MSKRPMPSLTALQCFEAVARHLSATRAAQELHLTQSAVSKQLAQLESMLQNPLFRRIRKRLHLTPAGELYLGEVRKILNQVDMSSRYIQSYGGDTEVLTVTAPPTFASRWLIPRLLGFGERFPNIHLDIRTESDPFDLLHKQADVAFFFGEGTRPGAECLRLFDEEVVAVCAPRLLAGAGKSFTLAQLAGQRLLQLGSRPQAWHEWFAAKGMHSARSYHGPRFETFDMSIHAARAGCGIALVPRFLVEEELREDKLALAWPEAHRSQPAYHLAYAEHAADVPKIRALVQWVREQLPTQG
ncbi:LysR substrate-binding domain-containing protein [Bordetella sp. 2513F-2]